MADIIYSFHYWFFFSRCFFLVLCTKNINRYFGNFCIGTLVYRIDVHARLLILRKKSTLYGLILVCTFINFEKTFLPARLFHPARLLVSTFFHYCYNTEQQMTFIFQSSKHSSCQIIFHYIR